MSIPGLGQIPDQPATTSTTRTVPLRPGSEYRFTAPLSTSSSPLTVRLLSGTAEKDGTELAPGQVYNFTAVRPRILTWQGCELEVSGRTDDEEIKSYNTPGENPVSAWVNLHAKLQELREQAGRDGREGPRVLVTGGKGKVGKSSCVRTLTSYATKRGEQPLVVNTDPKDGMLSLPGSISASVFATIMDVEAADGWGATPASGPSTVPVKLPLAYSVGRRAWLENGQAAAAVEFKELVSRLAGRVSARLSEDVDVKRAGVLIDTAGGDGPAHVDVLAHVVDEFSVNLVIVLGSPHLANTLMSRFTGEKTSLGEPLQVIPLEGLDGGMYGGGEQEEAWAQHARERSIKEYFFGGGKRTLSPQIQQVDFDALVVYRYGDSSDAPLVRAEVSSVMEHWTLAVMHASTRDSADAIRAASVMGYVYISEVDEERRKLRVLAPVSGRLGDRPLVMGSWPEPFITLLG